MVNHYNADDGVELAKAIMQGTALAIIDGSYKDNFGTASWVIQGADERGEARGLNIAPGYNDDQSAYRSELARLHGIASYANTLCKHHDICEGSIKIGCDGISALDAVFDEQPVTSKTKHFDLITSIRAMIRKSPIRWKPKHVEGHQDDHLGKYLDRCAKLNIEMDLAAKAYWEEAMEQELQPQVTLTDKPWLLWLNEKKLVKNLCNTIYDELHSQPLCQYWTGRTHPKMSPAIYDSLDWDAKKKAMKAAPSTRQIWASKHTAGVFSHGRNVKRWRLRDNDFCPQCGAEETADHISQCIDPDAVQKYIGSVDKVVEALEKLNTAIPIIDIIKLRLYEWKTRKPFSMFKSTCTPH